jgi:hypothetical protein
MVLLLQENKRFANTDSSLLRYITLPSTVPVKQAATLGARLARRLIMEQKTLFLSNPLVWKDE